MSWNYRVIKRIYVLPYGNNTQYAVHEVYYDKHGKPDGVTVDAVFPSGGTREELWEDFLLYIKAFTKPTLDYSDFEYQEYRLRNKVKA